MQGNITVLAMQNRMMKRTGGMLIAVCGVEDVSIVQRNHVVVTICPEEQAQKVKTLVERIKTI